MKIFFVLLGCLVLVACNKSNESQVLNSTSNDSHQSFKTAIPDCDKRNQDGMFINGKGCSEAERKAFWAQYH